ncbi:Protein zwilch [Nymphon striatum]|nr:Protein zwilch [Nymphon striatum]
MLESIAWPSTTMYERKKKSIKQVIRKPSIPKHERIDSRSNKTVDEDLTGSPLKCPFDTTSDDFKNSSVYIVPQLQEVTSYEEVYSPISVRDARNLLNKLYLSSEDDSLPPIWIVCDGCDKSKTALFAVSKTDEFSHRAIVTTNGPLKLKNCPEMSKIKADHIRGVNDSKITTDVSAIYNVSHLLMNNDFENEKTFESCDESKFSDQKTHLKLKCTWNTVTELLEWPSNDASTILQASVCPGNENSACYNLFLDFQNLINFIDGLNSGEISWTGNEENIMDKLVEFAQCQKIRNRLKQENESTSTNFDDCFEMKVVGKRLNLDFTDRVWEILTACSNYESLVQCFKYIFSALCNGDMFPFVFPKNNTGVANFVRQSTRGIAEMPSLDGTKPLTLLIETGIEKLKRDFLHFFISKLL